MNHQLVRHTRRKLPLRTVRTNDSAPNISLTRNVMTAMQIFRWAEQRGACCSSTPRYCRAGDGGPYRNYAADADQ